MTPLGSPVVPGGMCIKGVCVRGVGRGSGGHHGRAGPGRAVFNRHGFVMFRRRRRVNPARPFHPWPPSAHHTQDRGRRSQAYLSAEAPRAAGSRCAANTQPLPPAPCPPADLPLVYMMVHRSEGSGRTGNTSLSRPAATSSVQERTDTPSARMACGVRGKRGKHDPVCVDCLARAFSVSFRAPCSSGPRFRPSRR